MCGKDINDSEYETPEERYRRENLQARRDIYNRKGREDEYDGRSRDPND